MSKETPWWQEDLGEEVSVAAWRCYVELAAVASVPLLVIGLALYMIATHEYPCPSRGCGG